MKTKMIAIIMGVFLASLLIWELWPDQLEIVQLEFREDQRSINEEVDCHSIQDITERNWDFSYPKSISRYENKIVIVTLQPGKSIEKENNSTEHKCVTALEVNLDVPGIHTEPGQKIIQSYQKEIPLSYIWKIKKGDGSLSGTLWIHLLISDQTEGTIARYPLFAVPIEMKTFSLFGFSFREWRLFLLSTMTIILGVIIAFRMGRNYPE